MWAVMSEDSSRHGSRRIRWAAASTAMHTTERTTRLTTSSSGVGASTPKNETMNATTARAPSEVKTSRYIENRPMTAKIRFQTAVSELPIRRVRARRGEQPEVLT